MIPPQPRPRWHEVRYPIATAMLTVATLLHLKVWLDAHTAFTAVVVVVHIIALAVVATLTWRNRR